MSYTILSSLELQDDVHKRPRSNVCVALKHVSTLSCMRFRLLQLRPMHKYFHFPTSSTIFSFHYHHQTDTTASISSVLLTPNFSLTTPIQHQAITWTLAIMRVIHLLLAALQLAL